MARQIAIDTETTGLSTIKGRHRVIEIALVEIIDGKLTGNSFQSYFSPEGRKSRPLAFKTHKIKDSFLLDKPLFKNELSKILKFIGKSKLIFFNKDFDLEFLDNETKLADSDITFSSTFKSQCAQQIVMEALKRKRKISLDDACRMYNVDILERTTHGALIDAQLTAKLYLELSSRSKLISKVPHKKNNTEPEKFPLPRAYEGYQINFCKNPKCENYGKPPKFPDPIDKTKLSNNLGNYEIRIIRLQNSESRKVLYCKLCKTTSITFNNKSIIQEVKRLQSIY
jgi:DNA polymerase III epsilon subunit